MNILYLNKKDKFIAYNKHIASKKKAPCVIFNHGFMSNMNGDKAMYLENFCIKRNYHYIRFDNFGCGQSSGTFLDQTISTWTQGAQSIIDIVDGNIILVGSSLGAWITFLTAIQNKDKISGIVTIAAAFDCTEELIFNKLSYTQKQQLEKTGETSITGTDKNCSHTYPINKNLIEDGRKNLLLNKNEIDIACPVHLVHGMLDVDVPYSISQRTMAKIKSDNIVLKLIKDGDHRLSRNQDLAMICNSVDEIVSLI